MSSISPLVVDKNDEGEWKLVTKKDKKARMEKRKHKYTLDILSNKILNELHGKKVYIRMNRYLTGVEIHLTAPPRQDSRQILTVTFDLEHFNITRLHERQWFAEDESKSNTPALDVDISYWLKRMTTQVVWMRVAKDYEFNGLEMYKNVPTWDEREIGVVKFMMSGIWLLIDDGDKEESVFIHM